MRNQNSRLVMWLIFLLALVMMFYPRSAKAEDSAVEIFQDIYFDDEYQEYEKDERQDMTTFFVCRELDRLGAELAANELARQEDNRELRGQLWRLALLVGGGGAVGGAGGAAVIRMKKKIR